MAKSLLERFPRSISFLSSPIGWGNANTRSQQSNFDVNVFCGEGFSRKQLWSLTIEMLYCYSVPSTDQICDAHRV